jgi:glutamate synthase (ferredoxin)
MVDLLPLSDADDIAEVRELIDRHVEYTDSSLGREILSDWDVSAQRFVKVFPRDYRRVLEAVDRAQQAGLTGDEAVMEAFMENVANG